MRKKDRWVSIICNYKLGRGLVFPYNFPKNKIMIFILTILQSFPTSEMIRQCDIFHSQKNVFKSENLNLTVYKG